MALVSSLQNTSILSSFAINALLLSIRLFLSAVTTGYFKYKEKTPLTAEDAKVMNVSDTVQYQLTPEQVAKINNPDTMVNRVLRIHRNDVENILPFLTVCIPMVLVCLFQESSSSMVCLIANLLMYSFTASRFAFYVFYLKGIQPHRSLAWMVGVFSTLSIGVFTLIMLL